METTLVFICKTNDNKPTLLQNKTSLKSNCRRYLSRRRGVDMEKCRLFVGDTGGGEEGPLSPLSSLSSLFCLPSSGVVGAVFAPRPPANNKNLQTQYSVPGPSRYQECSGPLSCLPRLEPKNRFRAYSVQLYGPRQPMGNRGFPAAMLSTSICDKLRYYQHTIMSIYLNPYTAVLLLCPVACLALQTLSLGSTSSTVYKMFHWF